MKKTLIVFGTQPEAIIMASVEKLLQQASDRFAPTEQSQNHPLKEKLIVLTGNTVIDALFDNVKSKSEHPVLDEVKDIAKKFEGNTLDLVHLTSNLQKPVCETLKDVENVKLITPQLYEVFVWLRAHLKKLIMTYSRRVQGEVPSFGKPLLVIRETAERPEAVDSGTVILVGTDEQKNITKTV